MDNCGSGITDNARWCDTGGVELCGCGEPLHYSNPATEETVKSLVEQFGETVVVDVPYINRGYLVPRHYIALHGLAAIELPELAERYGWERV